jgi:Trypsin
MIMAVLLLMAPFSGEMKARICRSSTRTLLSAVGLGCPDAGSKPIGEVVEAVYKGVSVSSFEAEWVPPPPPAVAVYHPDRDFSSSELPAIRPCSGMQLSPYWILTAKHCVTDTNDRLYSFSGVFVSNKLSPGRQRPSDAQSAREIILQPNGADAALVRIDGYSYSPNRLPLFYPGTTASLVGKTLTCYGYGNSSGFAETDINGAGTLRSGQMKVSSVTVDSNQRDAEVYVLDPLVVGVQLLIRGDSGGPCIYAVRKFDFVSRFLTGIHTYGAISPNSSPVDTSVASVITAPIPGRPLPDGSSPSGSTQCGRFDANQALVHRRSQKSCDGRFSLVMQDSGNLLLYQSSTALWDTRTYLSAAYTAIMQSDGNFVLYDWFNTPIWSTRTHGHFGAYAFVQDDGNFVIYSSTGVPLWESNTCCH